MEIQNLLKNTLGGTTSLSGQKTSAADDFSDMVTKAIENVADKQRVAEKMSVAAANGENVAMHEVIQAVSEAELTLKTMLTVRDKAVEAYQEILRMPI